jgi:sensor histidine kinase YesM
MRAFYFLKRYNLLPGIVLAIFFPGVFVFDKSGKDMYSTVLLFFTFCSFILLLWVYNAVFVDFTRLLRDNDYLRFHPVYRNIFISFLLSVPLYFLLGIIFRQQHVLFSSLIESNFSAKAWFYAILRIVLFDAGLLVVKFIIDNNNEKQRYKLENEILKNEKLKAVHESLRQQVDPHFLFNSLNTLQSLVKQGNTDSSLDFIKELAFVYRYMLKQRDKELVPVGEELEFLKSYIYLLKIRFGDAFRATIAVNQDHISSKMPVHTLQLLAENAVKHNAVDKQKPLLLEIRSVNQGLVVSNNLLPKQQQTLGAGIGLQNISRRYALLFGKEICITNQDGFFKVILPIIDNHETVNN